MTLQPESTEANASRHAETLPSATPTTYDVTVHRTDYLFATVRVIAASVQHAELQAESVASGMPRGEWHTADSDLYAFECEAVDTPEDTSDDSLSPYCPASNPNEGRAE
ncbi:MAG: hypothetical protein QM770_01140 [Tepidisphaeraceae bacterium]